MLNLSVPFSEQKKTLDLSVPTQAPEFETQVAPKPTVTQQQQITQKELAMEPTIVQPTAIQKYEESVSLAQKRMEETRKRIAELGYGASRFTDTTGQSISALPKTGVGASFVKGFASAFGATSTDSLYSQAIEQRISEDDRKGAEKVSQLAGSFAGNAVLYALARGVVGAIPGLSAKATFAGKQGIDLLIDNIAQAPQGIIKDISEDKSATEIAKNLAKQNAVDLAINLVLGGLLDYRQSKKVVEELKESADDVVVERVKDSKVEETFERLFKQEQGEQAAKVGAEEPLAMGKETIEAEFKEVPGAAKQIAYEPEKAIFREDVSGLVDKGKKFLNTTVERATEFMKNEALTKSVVEPLRKAQSGYVNFINNEAKELADVLPDQFITGNNAKKLRRIVQLYGEGVIDDAKATSGLTGTGVSLDQIKSLDEFFRTKYNTFITSYNTKADALGLDKIPFREDYYRHMSDFGFADLLERAGRSNSQIPDIGDFIKAKGKTASIMKERIGGKVKYDAVAGYVDYLKQFAYIDNFNPYAKQLQKVSDYVRQNSEATGYANMLKTVADDLSGRPVLLDKAVEQVMPEFAKPVYKGLQKINSLSKASAIVGNIGSAFVSQAFNTPAAIAKVAVESPTAVAKGFADSILSVLDKSKRELYKQSDFLKARKVSEAFDMFEVSPAKRAFATASELVEKMDSIYTTNIWNMYHNQALQRGLKGAEAINFADTWARKSVAGRMYGDIPLVQRQQVTRMLAPFTLEVSNQWQFLKDMKADLPTKQFLGALATMAVVMNVSNDMAEKITGRRIGVDFIEATTNAFKDAEGAGETALKLIGYNTGEYLSNTAYGQYIAALGSEFMPYGKATEFFGVEQDPTRYGITGLPMLKPFTELAQGDVGEALLSVVPGGGQIKKTTQAAQALGLGGLGEEIPGSFSDGRLRTPIEPTPAKIVQALLFGQYSLPEVREYFSEEGRLMSPKQTDKFISLVTKTTHGGEQHNTINADELFDAITYIRNAGLTKMSEQKLVLDKRFDPGQVDAILKYYYDYK